MIVTVGDWRESGIDERERYHRYLCSREWAVLKEQVKKRSGGTCERCRLHRSDAVHHLTYIRKYRERLEDLRDICNACHEFTHGKRDRDPVLDAPPMIGGVVIESVYLAGRFSPRGPDNWRCRICPGYVELGSECDNETPWGALPKSIPIPDGRRLSCAGPWFIDLGHGMSQRGPHACADDVGGGHGMLPDESISSPKDVAKRCLDSLARADMVFAWVDSRECYGTLVEAGLYRRGTGGILVVAMPAWDRELWFVASLAHRLVIADTPDEAWEWLWGHPEMSFNLGPVKDSSRDQSDSEQTDEGATCASCGHETTFTAQSCSSCGCYMHKDWDGVYCSGCAPDFGRCGDCGGDLRRGLCQNCGRQ